MSKQNDGRPPARSCTIGEYCDDHDFIHGAEAEELRERLAKLKNRRVNAILDDVDARDAMAYLDRQAARSTRMPLKAQLDALPRYSLAATQGYSVEASPDHGAAIDGDRELWVRAADLDRVGEAAARSPRLEPELTAKQLKRQRYVTRRVARRAQERADDQGQGSDRREHATPDGPMGAAAPDADAVPRMAAEGSLGGLDGPSGRDSTGVVLRNAQTGEIFHLTADDDLHPPRHYLPAGSYEIEAWAAVPRVPSRSSWCEGCLSTLVEAARSPREPLAPQWAPGIDSLLSVNAALHAVQSAWRIDLQEGQAVAVPTPDVQSEFSVVNGEETADVTRGTEGSGGRDAGQGVQGTGRAGPRRAGSGGDHPGPSTDH